MKFALIDPPVLMRAVNNDEKSFQHLLRIFLRVVPEMHVRLEAGLQVADREAIHAQAHSLKSALGMVGAMQTSEKLAQLEKAAFNPHADLSKVAVALGAEIARVLAEVRICLGPSGLEPEQGERT